MTGFKYHWRFKNNKIVNLCFADDLMIFCHRDVSFVRLVKEALHEFELLSGLSHSLNKSHVFFSSVRHTAKQEILNIVDFQEGKIFVRYIGTHRALSYAGKSPTH